jgi:hypothetical protein
MQHQKSDVASHFQEEDGIKLVLASLVVSNLQIEDEARYPRYKEDLDDLVLVIQQQLQSNKKMNKIFSIHLEVHTRYNNRPLG